MSLTAKQEAFAQAVADGMSQSDAYRSAYKAEKMAASSVHVNASKLLADTKVAQRVAELKAALASRSLWSREQSVERLIAVFTLSDRASDHVSAVRELNAMHGFNAAQKHEVAVSGGLVLVPAKNG